MSDISLGKLKKHSNYVYKGLNTHSKPTRVWVEHGSRHCTLERRIFMFACWFVSSNSGLSLLVDHPSLTPMAIWRVFFPYFETDPLRNLRGRIQFIVKNDHDLRGFSGVWHWSCHVMSMLPWWLSKSTVSTVRIGASLMFHMFPCAICLIFT